MSGGGRILEQDDPFADLVPQKAKPQSSGEVDPFQDLVPKDPFQDLVPRKPIAIPERPAAAASDATRVGPEPVNLAGLLQQHAPGQSGSRLTNIAETGMELVTHPGATARGMVEQPFRAGMTVGEFGQGRAGGKAAAIAVGQTAAMIGTGPGERLAEPLIERVIGARLAPFATRTAIGAASGSVFTPDDPMVGAALGAIGGAISSRGVAAQKLAERIARMEAWQRMHPDWFSETPSTPAAAESRQSRLLEDPNRTRASAQIVGDEPTSTEPDYTVEDPLQTMGPFKGALVDHGKKFVDATQNPPPEAPTALPVTPPGTTMPLPFTGEGNPDQSPADFQAAEARDKEIDRKSSMPDEYFQAKWGEPKTRAAAAAGWPEPTPDAVDHFGDGAFDISHEETARELWMHASDHFTATDAIAQGVTGRKRDELERAARNADETYNSMLSQYEDMFGPEGVAKFLEKTGLPGDLTGGIESMPDSRDFRNRIATGEPATRAEPAGVAGLVRGPDGVRHTNPIETALEIMKPKAIAPQPPKKLDAAVKSPFGVVVSVPGKSLHLDPDRFQFKHQGIDQKSGAGAWVKGAKRYNPVLGGVWVTWIDPADGKEYVVNSHHRKAIYDNDITPDRPANVNVLRIEAADAQEARAIGARINIAEGHGTPLDVAQFIRDSGLKAGDLEKEGISLRGDLARQGSALAQLTPDLLAKVGTGELAENHGVAIGEMLPGEPELQREVVGEVKRSGRRLSADDVREVARQVHAAGTTDVRQETLFGGEIGRRPLFVERAQLAAAILKKLGQDRRILGFVAQEQRAQILAKGGNVIDVEKSRELADQSGQLEELFQRLYTREGPIAKVLTQAASRVAHGQKVKAVADDIYAAVADAIQAEIKAGTGSGASDRSAEGERSVSPGAAENGEVTKEEVHIDPNQEGFGIAEPGFLKRALLKFDEPTWDALPTKDKQQLIESLGFHKLTAEEQAAKPWKDLQPAVKDAVRPDMHALLDRMYRNGRWFGEPEMRPETLDSYNRFLAKRKATWLGAFRETHSIEKASASAGVSPSTSAAWRKSDPEFAAAVDEIQPNRKGKLRSAQPKPEPVQPKPAPVQPKPVPVSTRIIAGDLKGLVDQLRAAVIDAGGLVNSRHLRSFNQEAAAIAKRLAQDPEKARTELEELAEDFTPISGLEEEQAKLHQLLIDEERRTAKQRDQDTSPEAVAHRERQQRYQAKKNAAGEEDAQNGFVTLYREAKAARETRIREADGDPYQTDLFVGNGENVKPELRTGRKPTPGWPFHQLKVRKTTTPHVTLWGGMFNGKTVLFQTQPKPADFAGKEKLNYIELTLESGEITDKELRELAQLAQMNDKREIRYRRRGELRGAMRSVEIHEPKQDHPYEYSSTQVNLPVKMAEAVKRMAAEIPDEDLAENGREEFPHITIKYGLHGTDPEAVRKLLADVAPFSVDMEATSFFPNGESGNGDVLKVDVDSPALHALNKKIADALPHTDTHPTYQPHATIAYLKPGLGKKYAGNGTLMGRSVRVTSVAFSDKNGKQTRIKLGGKESPAVVIFDRHGFLESKTRHEIDTIGEGHHSQTFSEKALDIQDKGVLAYMNRQGDITVNVAADADVSDKQIRRVVSEHWPHVVGKDVTIIRQNAGIQESSVVEDLRIWEKDLFGYSGSPEASLFPDEETGKAGPPKPTKGGYEVKAKEARDRADFLKKQLARLQKSLETFDHGASANNRPANDLARKIDAVKTEIADLERIANFAEKITPEEIAIRTEEAPSTSADDKSLDMFKEPDIEPSKLMKLMRDLDESVTAYMHGLPELGKQFADMPQLMAQFRGLQAGMERVAKGLREEMPKAEKKGSPSDRLSALAKEWGQLIDEHSDLTTEWVHERNLPKSMRKRADFHFPGDMAVWEDPSQTHLFYTYGSVERAEAAARHMIDQSGKYITMSQAESAGQKMLSSRQRKRNVETARKGAFVDIVGKTVENARDIAQLLHGFRSPEMERLHVILTDDAGKVLSHTMETSGAINYSVISDKLAKTIARRARVVGATRVHLGHNHPSGDPTPSPEDKKFTAQIGYQLRRHGIRLVDHVVINHTKYAWIQVGSVYREHAQILLANNLPYDLPALSDRSDWTQGHGGKVASPRDVASLGAAALQGDDFGLLYMTTQGHTVALEPRPIGDLATMQKWLRDALKEHAADKAAIVYDPSKHGNVIEQMSGKFKNFPSLAHGVFDVVSFDGTESMVEHNPDALPTFRASAPLLPSPSRSLIGEEGGSGYGGSANGGEGEGQDRSEAAAENDRRREKSSAVPAEAGHDRGSESGSPAELHDPQLERSGGVLARLAYEVRRLLTPAVLTRESAQTARVLRAASGRAAHRKEMASHALRQFSRELTRLSPEKRMAFMHQIETGEKVTTTPGMAAAADMLRAELDRVRDRVRGLGTGKLENFIENYLPHIYKDPKRARTLIQQMMQRRPLEGNKSWLKKRSIPTLKDAMEIGLEPITDNPIDLALLRIYQMNKYVMAHEILQELKAKGPQFLKFVGAHEKPPIGYRPIDDSAFTVFGRPAVPVKEAFDPVLRGHLEEILKRLGGKHERTINMREWGTAQGSQVKTKFGGDIGVLMHEIGHVLDTKFGVWDKLHEPIEHRPLTRGKRKGQPVPTDAAIAHRVKVDAELRALADLRMEGQNPDDVAEHHKKYLRSRAEKIANAIHALVYMPDRMGGVAPTVKAALEQLLQGTPAADILNPKRGVALGVGVAEKGIYGTLITGKYFAPDAVATVINNFLSGGLRGNPIYDAYMGIGNSLNQAQLGLSFFHLGFTSLDAMVSKLALAMQQTARGQLVDAGKSLALFPFAAVSNFAQGFQVYRAYLDPERAGKFDQVVKAIEMAGGKIKLDEFYRNDNWKKMIEGFYHKDPITVLARAPLAGFELTSRFILEFVVPRQKLGVFADMFMMEAKRLGPDATEDELRRAAQKAWDSTDNRMGQMVYDNLMWNRVLKDISMGLVRAVGWDLGTFRELIGGSRDLVKLPVKSVRRLSDRRQKLLPRAEEDEQQQDRPDPLFTHKAAYLLALFAGVGALGAVLNKGMTGEWPQDMRDVWTPRTGKMNDEGNPERVELPSYVKDVFSYLGHGFKGTVQTALHKLHPMLNYVVSVIQNEDYYGNMIRNDEDDALTQFKQEVKYALKQWEPFGFRNAAEQAKRNQSRPVQIGNFIGITPAHRSDTRTPAENKMADILRAKGRSGLTPEEAEQRQVRGELRTAKRTGKPKGTAIAEAMRSNPLSHRDAVKIWNDTGKSSQLEQFKRLDYLEAKKVWAVASAEEQRRWHSLYVQKRANYRALHGAAAGR